MHLDKYGLPVQADGDANDQLQRVGMIATAEQLTKSHSDLGWDCLCALATMLQPRPGIYIRHISANPNNVSADQLISVLCYWIASRNVKQAAWMFFRMLCRFGTAQNYKDGLSSDDSYKMPDIMVFRAAPLFARMHWSFYPVALVTDLLLVMAAIAATGPVWKDATGFARRTPDDVDINNLVMTLAVCRARMVTPLSWLACKILARFFPENLGSTNEPRTIQAALNHYHRASTGANPEISELYRPIVERYFYE